MFDPKKSRRDQQHDRKHRVRMAPSPMCRLNHEAQNSAEERQDAGKGRSHSQANYAFHGEEKQDRAQHHYR